MSDTIGLVGLGLVGSALLSRFRADGFAVHAFDIDADASTRAVGAGAIVCADPQAVADVARRIVLSLPDSDAVDAVVDALLANLREGDLVVDTTTSDPDRCVAVADRLRDRGIAFLDATILGSSRTVADGTCLVMVGGDTADLDRARDLLASFSTSDVHHLGPNGKGAETKLIVNLVLGLNRLVLAEGLLLGRKAGIDLAALLDVLKGGAAYSRVMDHKGERMIAGEFTPDARLAQHRKDVGLILDAGMRHDQRLPLSALHADILRAGIDAGLADLDNSAVINALEHYTTPNHE